MAAAPAFQFYASDFLTSTQSWDINEVGIYIRLLANQWANLKLPKETERLARIAGCDHETFKKAWVILGFKFLEGEDGFLRNRRLEVVREEKNIFLEKQRLNGLKGGRPKKENPKHNPDETQSKPKNNPTGNPKITPSSSNIDINIYKEFDFFNDEFASTWKDFKEMRVKIKSPLTQRAEKLNLSELSGLCNGDKNLAIEIVNQSIKKSWKGFFKLSNENYKNGKLVTDQSENSNLY